MIKATTFHSQGAARTAITLAGTLLVIWAMAGCAATSKKHPLKVTTAPSDALVCIAADGGNNLGLQAVAGPTPLEKNVEFGPRNKLWLQIEKRGYVSRRVAVTPDSGVISLDLERLHQADGTPVPEFGLPLIRRMLLVTPAFSVIERGFSSETVAQEASVKAQQALITAMDTGFKDKWEIVIPCDKNDAAQLKSLRRDGHTAMELTNPVHLPYQPEPLFLETASGRAAVQALARRYDADVIVLLEGKQIVENAGMVAGKIGMTVIGTANSYAGGYSRAMANGDSFFVYTIYTPHFSQGALIKALMIDGRNAEVLWTNQGLWKPINFEESQVVTKIIEDLFTGITDNN